MTLFHKKVFSACPLKKSLPAQPPFKGPSRLLTVGREMVPFMLYQIFRIEAQKLWNDEKAVLANKHVVKPNLPASLISPLNKHQIPVNGASVAVVRVAVRATWGKVNRAGNLFVKQCVAHGFQNIGIHTQRKLANAPRTLVRI